MFYLHKDLHLNLADRLDVTSLLNCFRILRLKLPDFYWKRRVSESCNVANLDTWQVSDWSQVLYETSYISDFHKLTLAISWFRDFLNREFSVYRLSTLKNIPSNGYFTLWKTIQVFLSSPEIPACQNFSHNRETCLCGFHKYLSENKMRIKGFIYLYMDLCYRQKGPPKIYFQQNQMSLTDHVGDLYYQMINLKISQNNTIQLKYAQSENFSTNSTLERTGSTLEKTGSTVERTFYQFSLSA